METEPPKPRAAATDVDSTVASMELVSSAVTDTSPTGAVIVLLETMLST